MAKKKNALKKNKGQSDVDSSNGVLTAKEVSKKYNVAELKDILKENGLSVKGKKKDLVERVLPILNDDSSEASGEAEKVDAAQPEDSSSVDDVDLSSLVGDEFLTSALSIFGVNYDDLAIEEKIIKGKNSYLNIKGFIQDGISMSDSTMSILAASDSSNVRLKMNIPEVSYSNFENTIFTFKDLDLFIFPSSNPQSLEFSAVMGGLEIITDTNYVNLKDLNLFFKSFPDENGIRLDIDINSFIFPDFNDTSINFEGLDLKLSIGLDGQSLVISVNLPALNLLNKNYRVNLSDLDLNVVLPDLQLSNLDLSIKMADFHYTNFEDVYIDMDNVDVLIETIPDSNNLNVITCMNSFDAGGLNSFDELFPMIDISSVSFKAPADNSEPPIKLVGLMSLLDISKMDLSKITSLLVSGFDVDTYIRNMPDQFKGALNVNAVDVSGEGVSGFSSPGFDLGVILENFDYSSLDGIVLNLSGLLDSAGIDLADFGIDVSGYDLSAIKISEIMDILNNSGFDMSAIESIFSLFSIDLSELDLSSLIVSFDADKFDISGLLNSLNFSDEDISRILGMLNNLNIDWEAIFTNFDFSLLDGIELDLSGLLKSAGIDLADFGIDVSGYDLSAIKISEIMAILNNFDFDMSDMAAMFNLSGIDFEKLDMSALISSFDVGNFDLSSLLASLNISGEDISGIMEMFNNSDIDWEAMFKDCDYSCFDAIVLDLSGLLDSAGIDLAELGIDVSDYDLSAIKLSEFIDILTKAKFDMSMLDLSNLKLDELDVSGLIVSFDTDKFDISSLLSSLNLSGDEFPAIMDMFNNSGLDFEKMFKDCDYSCFDAIVLDLSGLIESIGIDLAELGIDVSDYDLSAISVSDLIGILNKSDFDMAAMAPMFKLFNIDFEKLDTSALISSFDFENLDIYAILNSLNLPVEDISAIMEIFNNLDLDWESIFKNCDYSCFDAIVLDLSGLIESAGIDLAELGIDVSDYDLSAISVSDLIDILNKSDFDMAPIAAMCKLFSMDLNKLDMSDLIVSFDLAKIDLSGIIAGLEASGMDIEAILEMFNMYGFDLEEFMGQLLGSISMENNPEDTSVDNE